MKRTPLKRKSKLRKHSLLPVSRLKLKADRRLQDFYRAKYPQERCEGCGGPFELMHHFYEKSQSAGLRFEPDNLIFLCHRCHFRHHRTGDAEIMSNVIERRGLKWLARLKTLRLARKNWQIDRPFLEKQLKTYDLSLLP